MRLLVLRHAEAGNPAGVSDVDRPLTDAGRTAAAALADVVERLDPDLVLCSVARRTQETVEQLHLDPGVEVQLEHGLYNADVDQLLEFVRLVDDEVATVLVVAHNPGVRDLMVELSGGERLPAIRPATLAVFELDHEHWWETGPASGRLVSVHVPDPDAE